MGNENNSRQCVALGNTALLGYGDLSQWVHLSFRPSQVLSSAIRDVHGYTGSKKVYLFKYFELIQKGIEWPIIIQTYMAEL